MLTPAQFQEKHARRLKASVEDMRTGIEGVTKAPGVAAAAKSKKMIANLTEAVNNGTWGKRVAAVSLEDWKRKAIDVGLTRVASGIDAASEKVTAFAAQLLPAIKHAQSSIESMPDMTLSDNIARMSKFVTEMSKFKKA